MWKVNEERVSLRGVYSSLSSVNENSIGYILLEYVDGTRENYVEREGERLKAIVLLFSNLLASNPRNDEKKRETNLPWSLSESSTRDSTRGFPRRSPFKAEPFSFEAKGKTKKRMAKRRISSCQPERRSEESGKKRREKKNR